MQLFVRDVAGQTLALRAEAQAGRHVGRHVPVGR